MNKITGFILTILIGGMVSACGTENRTSHDTNLHLLSLTKDMSISADNSNVLIGDFSGLAVDQSGAIYVADTRLQKIHLFSSDGQYMDSLGRQGKGPGEFTGLDPNIRILSDTLYAKDNTTSRINLFDLESRQPAGTITIPNAEIDGVRIGSARNMFPLSDGDILISFVNPYIYAPEEQELPHMTTISRIDKSGKFIEKNFYSYLHRFQVIRS